MSGGVKKKVMRNPYKNTKFVLHFIYMCVCDDGLYHAEDINDNFCSIVCALSLGWRPYSEDQDCNQNRWNAKGGNTSDVGTYMLCKRTVASGECTCGVNS